MPHHETRRATQDKFTHPAPTIPAHDDEISVAHPGHLYDPCPHFGVRGFGLDRRGIDAILTKVTETAIEAVRAIAAMFVDV